MQVSNYPGDGYAHEAITVSSTAVGPTAATINPVDTGTARINNSPSAVRFSVETNAIRYTTDGTAPTASVGVLVPAGATVDVVGSSNVMNLKMIRVTADAPVNLQYFSINKR